MKRRLWLLVLALWLPAWADPPKTEAPKIKTIFHYKTELGLSDAQIEAIKSELVNLNSNFKQSKAKIAQLEAEFRALIAREASTEEAKSKLQQIAEATVAFRLTDFETSRRITATMSAEQKARWAAIRSQLKPQTPVNP
ncbi:hypothetical protein IV102_16000 [bacterium]|nr:hypothetical protein [bacterium]